MRALETGRYVVVASTNGITGIIAPDGTATSALERRTQGYVVEQVAADLGRAARACGWARGRAGLPGCRRLRPRAAAAPVSSEGHRSARPRSPTRP